MFIHQLIKFHQFHIHYFINILSINSQIFKKWIHIIFLIIIFLFIHLLTYYYNFLNSY